VTTASPGTSPDTDAGIGSGFCRVQIAAPTTRVDLALPTTVPLAGLLPAIVGYAEQDLAAPQGWALSRLDGTRLDPAAGLIVAGIREGELLLLHSAHDSVGQPLYDDVVEVLSDAAAESGWTPRDTRVACAGLLALAVLGAVWAAVTTGTLLAGILLAVLAVLLLGGGSLLAHATGDLPAGTTLAALSAVVGATAGVVLLGRPLGPAHLVLVAAILVLVAAAGPPALGGGDAVFLALGIIGLLTLLGGLLIILVPATPARAAAVVAPLALALTTAMPTLALRLSRIPRPPLPRTAAELADVPGQLELDQIQQRVQRARALLTGLLTGCYAATTLATVVLTTDTDSPWPSVLAALLGVLLLLRGRLFRRRAQVAAPLVAAAVVFAAGLYAAASTWASSVPILLGVVAPAALALAAIAGGFGRWGGRGPLNPRLARALDLLETLLLLSVVPIVLAVWNVYTLLLELRA
jgi:type VII secretion integral membrane protein EccD